MPLHFQPKVGTVVRCDFSGMVPPEMVKMRDVVILAKHPKNSKLVTVVPLSATQPNPIEAYHYELPKNPRPDSPKEVVVWAKCDMLYTLSIDRMQMHYVRTRRGGRQVAIIHLNDADMAQIRKCVASWLKLT